jgi:hypothetical protein
MDCVCISKSAGTSIAVDWRSLLNDLHVTHRMTLVDIAMDVGSHRDTIRNYYSYGTSPSHLTGEKLIALWRTTTGKGREQLPMQAVIPSVARVRRW